MNALTGTGALVRLALRRDRVRLPVWVLGIVALLMSSVVSLPSVYSTAAEREGYTAAVGDKISYRSAGGETVVRQERCGRRQRAAAGGVDHRQLRAEPPRPPRQRALAGPA